MTPYLRLALFISGTVLLVTTVQYNFVNFTTAHSGSSPNSTQMLRRVIEHLAYFVLALPPVGLAFWAVHNLKPLKYFSDNFVLCSLKALTAASCLALIVNIALYIKIWAPYFPKLPQLNFASLMTNLNWISFSIVEILLLSFAAKQMQNKINNKKLSVT